MPSSLSWRRVTKIRGATCGRPKVKTSCARSTPPDRRSPPSSPTVTLFQRRHTSILVLYLDNLESLQTGPAQGDPEEFAEWRNGNCARLWKGLLDLQREAPGRLAALASSRYRHRDFGAVMP